VSRSNAEVDVISRCEAWKRVLPDCDDRARRAAGLALARGQSKAALVLPHQVELVVVLADDAEQRQLNCDWRGIDRPTNVLAFPAWAPGAQLPRDAPLLLGDVVLAFQTVAREAGEQSKPLADHFSHLIVHGVLHLLGFDHASEGEAVEMERLETSILAELGVADPYRGTM
jgi:probable rRNA maturation factor